MRLLMCCGMSRSGGTLQYQIAEDVVSRLELGKGIGLGMGLDGGAYEAERGWFVCKREPPHLKHMADIAISIYRDPRDVVCSFMRWRGEQGRRGDFVAALKETIAAVEWFTEWEPICSHVARYEEFDAAEESKIIAGLLERELNDDTAQTIANLYTVDKNLETIEDIKAEGGWMHPILMLTAAHIGSHRGASVWRDTLTFNQLELVEYLLGEWMQEHEYQLCMPSG